MSNHFGGKAFGAWSVLYNFHRIALTLLAAMAAVWVLSPSPASAQTFVFNSVQIDGNQRVEDGTILSYAGIARGQRVSAAELNDAYQNVLGSGLFETVEFIPQGGRLLSRF